MRLLRKIYLKIRLHILDPVRPPSLRGLAKWHTRCEEDLYCPFCGQHYNEVKKNGDGLYRCRQCDTRWFIMKAND